MPEKPPCLQEWVYGDLGETEATEDNGPLVPVSTYGASKLASEALISSYRFMFGISGCVFRFQQCGCAAADARCGFRFRPPASHRPTWLTILGDGMQSKRYVHVDDMVDAVIMAEVLTTAPFTAYSMAPGNYITVREIARLACEGLNLEPGSTALRYTGGDRGWKGGRACRKARRPGFDPLDGPTDDPVGRPSERPSCR